MGEFDRYVAGLKEQREMLIGQIAFWETAPTLRMIGETAEATAAGILVRLRQDKVDLDILIHQCEAMQSMTPT